MKKCKRGTLTTTISTRISWKTTKTKEKKKTRLIPLRKKIKTSQNMTSKSTSLITSPTPLSRRGKTDEVAEEEEAAVDTVEEIEKKATEKEEIEVDTEAITTGIITNNG